jgi:hypothetical protein
VKVVPNGKSLVKNAGFIGRTRRAALNTLRSGAINNIYKSAFYSILVMGL